jgi:hypothetical protein
VNLQNERKITNENSLGQKYDFKPSQTADIASIMSKKDKTEALLHFYQDKRSLASIPSSKAIPTFKA